MEVTYDAALARELGRVLRGHHLRSLARTAVVWLVLLGAVALLVGEAWVPLLVLPLWLLGQRKVLAALLRSDDVVGTTVGAAYDGDVLVLTRGALVRRYAPGSIRRIVPHGALLALHSRTPGVPPRLYPAALLDEADRRFLVQPVTGRPVEPGWPVWRAVGRALARDLLLRPWILGLLALLAGAAALTRSPLLAVLTVVLIAWVVVVSFAVARLTTPYAARLDDAALRLSGPRWDVAVPRARLRLRRRSEDVITLRRGFRVVVLPAGLLSPGDLALLSRS